MPGNPCNALDHTTAYYIKEDIDALVKTFEEPMTPNLTDYEHAFLKEVEWILPSFPDINLAQIEKVCGATDQTHDKDFLLLLGC